MNGYRIRAILLALAVAFLDGFDALSMSFAAPAISGSWVVDKAVLGVVFSSSLAGMALGALVLAPLADIVGRKMLMLIGLTLMTLGSALAAVADSIEELMLWRLLTGVGIGASAIIIFAIATEFANARTRPMALAVMAVGYPIGGLVGGLLASVLLTHFSWRSVFLAGFVLGAVAIPFVAVLLPESLTFLLGREQHGRLERINRILTRSGLAAIAATPAVTRVQRSYAGVFAREQRPITFRLALVSALNMSTGYFALSWLPQVVYLAGFPPPDASLVAAIFSFAGVLGGLSFGLLTRGRDQTRLAALLLIVQGAPLALFGITPPSLMALMVAGAVCGLFLYAASTSFYTILPQNFAGSSRAAGTGFVMGVGRVTSAVAPAMAGVLLAHHFSIATVFALFGAVATSAGLILLVHRSAPARVAAMRAVISMD